MDSYWYLFLWYGYMEEYNMVDLNLGVSLLLIGVVLFAIFMLASSSCFLDKFDSVMPILFGASVILSGIGIVIISMHVVFI